MNPSLINEVCRVFNTTRVAMVCAMSHSQLTIDGYVILPAHDRRWPTDRLRGRYARLHDRQAQLFGSKVSDGC